MISGGEWQATGDVSLGSIRFHLLGVKLGLRRLQIPHETLEKHEIFVTSAAFSMQRELQFALQLQL